MLWKCVCGEVNLGVSENCRVCSRVRNDQVIVPEKKACETKTPAVTVEETPAVIIQTGPGFMDVFKIAGWLIAAQVFVILATMFSVDLIYGKYPGKMPDFSRNPLMLPVAQLFLVRLMIWYGAEKYG